jgi:protoheme IX farnesyltransferase
MPAQTGRPCRKLHEILEMKAQAEAGAVSLTASRGLVADLTELVKARLTTLVLLTTLVGFCMGSSTGIRPGLLGWTLLGTALLACGAAALNQVFERHLDALMLRTRTRPLPAGRMNPKPAAVGGAVAGLAGVLLLATMVNPLAAVLGAATLLSYLFVYTPLKTRAIVNTLVGAVPGALPPVIGWVAARGELGLAGGSLFLLQFFWQIPHFLAIAWLYRQDYARAGLRMMPVVDSTGVQTGRHAVAHAGALLIASLLPVGLGMAGAIYGVGAFLAGVAFLWLTLRFARERSDVLARQLFLGSVIYLPVVLGLMVFDRIP